MACLDAVGAGEVRGGHLLGVIDVAADVDPIAVVVRATVSVIAVCHSLAASSPFSASAALDHLLGFAVVIIVAVIVKVKIVVEVV